jgi:hypothetical protein
MKHVLHFVCYVRWRTNNPPILDAVRSTQNTVGKVFRR